MGMIDEIRAQYEKLAAQNKMEAEDMIKARVAKAADQAAKDAVAIKDFKEQVGEYRKTVQTLHMEIDSLRSAVSNFFCSKSSIRSGPFGRSRLWNLKTETKGLIYMTSRDLDFEILLAGC